LALKGYGRAAVLWLFCKSCKFRRLLKVFVHSFELFSRSFILWMIFGYGLRLVSRTNAAHIIWHHINSTMPEMVPFGLSSTKDSILFSTPFTLCHSVHGTMNACMKPVENNNTIITKSKLVFVCFPRRRG
jgi:hypothetical protein